MVHFKERYTAGKLLGKGTYAAVYECRCLKSGVAYAVKVVDKTKAGPKDVDSLSHEIHIMERIGGHPHIVQLVEYFETPRHLYLVLDLLSGGMLFDRMVQMKHYSERDAAQVVRNILSALEHIHSKGVIHRDVKPENLLLRYSEDDAPTEGSHLTDVCLADFGLAGSVPSSLCCGSPSYIAPEVIATGYYRTRSTPYDTKCDIWSLGVIAFILLSGKMPFYGDNFKNVFHSIVSGRWGFEGDIWRKVSPCAISFVRACLTPEPSLRPSATELLAHPWLAEPQSNEHLLESLEGLRKFNAHQKMRAAVHVFCWTQSLLGRIDRTPPFMRYLRHEDKYSTVVGHQSQTNPKEVHYVDFGTALRHGDPGWRMQDCCTCVSQMVCRHVQNVHEYLFVGRRSMDVYPFIDELRMMKAEAEGDLDADPKDADARGKLVQVEHAIAAACVFSEQLEKVPVEELKPNFLLEHHRAKLFRPHNKSSIVSL